MDYQPVTPRACIFDVYGTLLEVGPPPPDAGDRFARLLEEFVPGVMRPSRLEFSMACNRVVAALHGEARSRGVPWPEVCWPEVVAEVLPGIRKLPPEAQARFIRLQIETGRCLRLAPGCAAALRELRDRGCLLGIASNSQAYTLAELAEALRPEGLSLGSFARDLSFWSFENGFSKPDPHVFQLLRSRLQNRGIRPAETLMVGDRVDNDIEPARACGWQVWQIRSGTGEVPGGDWSLFSLRWLSGRSLRL